MSFKQIDIFCLNFRSYGFFVGIYKLTGKTSLDYSR